MKKKLVIVSDESIVCGSAKTGVADVTDGLAFTLSGQYQTHVVCPDGNGSIPEKMKVVSDGCVRRFQLSGVNYHMIAAELWADAVSDVVDEIRADIFHNLSSPELLGKLGHRPARAIYTIDQASYVRDKLEYLTEYDVLTTVSKGYAEELLSAEDELSSVLKRCAFKGITNGINTIFCNPHTGIMIPATFNSLNQSGKDICKAALLKDRGIAGNPIVYSLICRLVPEKGIDAVLAALPTIRENNGMLFVYGRGDEMYESELCRAGAYWVKERPKLHRAVRVLAASDFYLSLSTDEPCGLMPMQASRYGAIPIVTQVGGLKDNFNSTNAIVVGDSVNTAIEQAASLYQNRIRLMAKRMKAMSTDFSWATRAKEYIEIYEGVIL